MQKKQYATSCSVNTFSSLYLCNKQSCNVFDELELIWQTQLTMYMYDKAKIAVISCHTNYIININTKDGLT